MERLAVLDIGSNSVRMMIAEAGEDGTVQVLSKDRRITRLAEGMVGTDRIGREAMARTLQGIGELLDAAQAANCTRILPFATAAVRNAKNREEFIQEFHRTTHLLCRVLTGEEEAKASFLGAAQGETAALIDIGGGSTEVMLGQDGESQAARSFPMGAVVAMERYPLGDPVDGLSLLAMEQWIQNVLRQNDAESVQEKAREMDMRRWICVGGTGTSLASMDLELQTYSDTAIHNHSLAYQKIVDWRDRLGAMKLEERRRVIGLDPARADIIVGGLTILIGLMDYFKIPGIRISSGDNLEGYLRMRLFMEPRKEN